MGNVGYSAPEQRVKGRKVDHRSDIFALGLILNELYTREVPHGEGYKTIESVVPQFAFLDQLVELMIQNNPEARPISIENITAELIGRGNTFSAQQRVDVLSKQVVPFFETAQVQPIRIVNPDWTDGRLILELNREPEIAWMRCFSQPSGGSWGSIQGSGPDCFEFRVTKQ